MDEKHHDRMPSFLPAASGAASQSLRRVDPIHHSLAMTHFALNNARSLRPVPLSCVTASLINACIHGCVFHNACMGVFFIVNIWVCLS